MALDRRFAGGARGRGLARHSRAESGDPVPSLGVPRPTRRRLDRPHPPARGLGAGRGGATADRRPHGRDAAVRDTAFLPDWPGSPADREGELIAEGLDTSTRCCSPTTASSPPAARCRKRPSWQCSWSAWRASRSTPPRSAAPSRSTPSSQAARDFLRTDRIMGLTFDAWSRRAERRRPPPLPRASAHEALRHRAPAGAGVTSAVVLFLMMTIRQSTSAAATCSQADRRRLRADRDPAGGADLLRPAAVSARRQHIVIDTFDPLFSRRLKRSLDMIAEVVCAVALAGVGFLIFQRARRSPSTATRPACSRCRSRRWST